MTDFYVSPVPVSPPPAYWVVRWIDGSTDPKTGKEIIHRGTPCSLDAARSQRDGMEMTGVQAWLEAVNND